MAGLAALGATCYAAGERLSRSSKAPDPTICTVTFESEAKGGSSDDIKLPQLKEKQFAITRSYSDGSVCSDVFQLSTDNGDKGFKTVSSDDHTDKKEVPQKWIGSWHPDLKGDEAIAAAYHTGYMAAEAFFKDNPNGRLSMSACADAAKPHVLAGVSKFIDHHPQYRLSKATQAMCDAAASQSSSGKVLQSTQLQYNKLASQARESNKAITQSRKDNQQLNNDLGFNNAGQSNQEKN